MARNYHRYEKEEFAMIVASCKSYAEVARRYGKSPVGGTCTHIRLMCQRWNICTAHMSGNAHNKGKPAKNKLSAEVRLSMGSPFDHRTPAHKLRRALFEIGVEYVCKQCNMPPLWRGEPITLEVDHIDECYWNNTRENLQFLCPNCHAQKTASTTNRTS